jgi:hypothetical protein
MGLFAMMYAGISVHPKVIVDPPVGDRHIIAKPLTIAKNSLDVFRPVRHRTVQKLFWQHYRDIL